MRVQFRAADVKHVILFVHRLTATERASIEVHQEFEHFGAEVWVDLTLGRTTMDDLRRYMAAVPGGEMMAETLTLESEQNSGHPVDWLKVAKRIPDLKKP